MKKCARFFGTSLLWLLLLGGLSWAGAASVEIKTERTIVQAQRGDGREFTLCTKVWTEDPLGLREPCKVLVADEKDGELAPALERIASEARKGEASVCLVLLAGESEPPEGEKGLRMLRSVQRVRDAGGQSFVCGKEGWEAFASAPADGHFFAPGEKDSCLDAARRCAADAYDVDVVEALDPRFTIAPQERRRLKEAGAQVRLVDGNWVVTWTVELPCDQNEPWVSEWTVEAKTAFPGGNGVAVCGEDEGVFLEGRQVAELPEVKANVGVNLSLRDVDTKIFLGETVPTVLGGESIEDKMLGGGPEWFGKGITGTFSFQWEDVGTVEQLGRLIPQESTGYRLRVVFTPKGPGSGAAGPPVEQMAAEGSYTVSVMPGVLRVQVVGEGLDRNSSLALRVESKAVSRTVIARPEADPEGGGLVLAAVLDDLPFGKYTVTPGVMADGKKLRAQECLLGVCREDDTVDVARRFGVVKFQV